MYLSLPRHRGVVRISPQPCKANAKSGLFTTDIGEGKILFIVLIPKKVTMVHLYRLSTGVGNSMCPESPCLLVSLIENMLLLMFV